MDWLFEKREKSLANSAQRVVADMHRHLEREKARNKELEEMIIKFQHLCTDSIENEVIRLEHRKLELLEELDGIEQQLKEKRNILENTKHEITSVLIGNNSSFISETTLIDSENHAQKMEEKYMEEIEIFDTCREVEPNLLFILHRSDKDDYIAYVPVEDHSHLVRSFRIRQIGDQVEKVGLSSTEVHVTYGPTLVPSHERDFPHVGEISIPYLVLDKISSYSGEDRAVYSKERVQARMNLMMHNDHHHSHNSTTISTMPSPTSSHGSKDNLPSLHDSESNNNHMPKVGSLVCALEIPWIPDIIIDVWLYEGMHWATTTINGVNFAVLERLLVIVDPNRSSSSPDIIQVEICGRHPLKGYIVTETVLPCFE